MRASSNVFFPWERRRGLAGWVLRARGRLAVTAALALTLVIVVVRREHQASFVRATRATIGDASRAVSAYRAANAGKCPTGFDQVVRAGFLLDAPSDAWGHALRLVCPGRKDATGFEVVSDGPDGEPFGLDRVE